MFLKDSHGIFLKGLFVSRLLENSIDCLSFSRMKLAPLGKELPSLLEELSALLALSDGALARDE